jgi:head-tail adaptor
MDMDGVICEVRTEVLFYIIQVNLSFQIVRRIHFEDKICNIRGKKQHDSEKGKINLLEQTK